MGGQQSSETNKEILNDTRVINSIKKFNETINESSVKMMQSTMVNAAAGADVNNTITIKGIKTKGAFILDGVSQKNMVKMNLSVLSKSEMKGDMVSDMTNKIQAQLTNDAKASADSSSKEGEQILAGIASAVSDTVQGLGNSLTGGSSSSKDNLSIKNIMNIENDTELINKVKTSVTQEMVNDTVTNVSLKINAGNELEIAEIEADDGFVISNLSQENVVDAMMEAVAESGLANKILSKMMNVDEADIKNAADSETTASDETVGTLDAAGDAVGNVIKEGGEAGSKLIDSSSGLISAGMTALIMPLLIIGVVGIALFFLAKPLLSKGMDKAKVGKDGKMTFGAGLFKGGSIKKLLNNSYIKQIKKQLMKYATMDNLIIGLSLIIGYKFLPKIFNYIKNFNTEKFTIKDNKKLIIFYDDNKKFLNLKDDKLIFDLEKPTDTLVFLLEIIKPNKKLQLSFLDKKGDLSFLMKHNKKLKIIKYSQKFAGKQSLNYHIFDKNDKQGDIVLGVGKKYFNKKFKLVKNKDDAFKFKYIILDDKRLSIESITKEITDKTDQKKQIKKKTDQ